MKKSKEKANEGQNHEKAFFLGANSAQGFVSFFDQLGDAQKYESAYIIKGGPGTGKSTLMRRIAKKAEEMSFETEYIYCSSDPDSLDGIIIDGIKKIVADGTPPHIIEPKYPGAFEKIININSLFNNKKLEAKKSEIISLLDKNKIFHRRTSVFIAAAGVLKGDSKRIATLCTKFEKIMVYTNNFEKNNITKKRDRQGVENKRFISAVTNKNVVFFEQTIKNMAEKIYNIFDPYGVVACQILQNLKTAYIKNGYDVYSCFCPLSPNEQLEHLIVPELKICFTTSNFIHYMKKEDSYRNISFKRFSDKEMLLSHRNRLNFNKKAILQMLNQAVEIEKEAKLNHDEVEKIYSCAVDFSENEKFFSDAVESVFQ